MVRPYDASGLTAFIHLAGHSIGERRWSREEKKLIRSSRVDATLKIAEQLSQLDAPPQVFICASAIGIYGNRGADILDESSSPGQGFLADVAEEWEAACAPLLQTNIRVCHARFGIILDPSSGALKKMLPIFKMCLGTPLGGGQQYWSWISLSDCLAALEHLIDNPASQGAYNFVAPHPVTNKEFSHQLARALKRCCLPAPSFATRLGLRLALGEMANELLLSSCRVKPTKLLDEGFKFRHPELSEYLAEQFS